MRRSIIIAFLLLVAVAAIAGGTGYWIVFMPNTVGYDGARGVKIPRGATLEEVADSLESNEILRSRATFEMVASWTGWGDQVKAGYYTFESGASNYRLLDVIRKGLQSPIQLTIPPGTRPEVVAAVAGSRMAFSSGEFAQALQDTALAARLQTDVAHLFGYMMPETYNFYWLNDAPTVVSKVKQQFDSFYEREISDKADSLGLNKEQVAALAAIVEWETGINEEKPRVAGVYLNRLRIGMALQADPTVQYAVMEKEGQKRRLLYEDLQVDHPFNTYRHAGLPPGPITNPSPSSIRAVVNPERHDYLYFVAKGDGSHTFSRTLAEHNRAAQQYYELMRERRREQAGAQ